MFVVELIIIVNIVLLKWKKKKTPSILTKYDWKYLNSATIVYMDEKWNFDLKKDVELIYFNLTKNLKKYFQAWRDNIYIV